MKTKRKLLLAVIIAAVCFATARLATSIQGRSPDSHQSHTIYQLDTVVATPEYQTEADRVIDAYERLMERFIDLAESQQAQNGPDCQKITLKLDSIDVKLDNISQRLERIEKAMGIDPNGNPPGVKKRASE